MTDEELRWKIRDVILFYECHGWCWLHLVHYLIWRHNHEQET